MVAHVSNGTGYTGAASTSHTVGMPAGLVNGYIVTVVFCVNNSATVSASGWTQKINEGLNGAGLVMMWTRVADAGSFPSSVTFTFSSSQSTNAGASAWSGAVGTGDPINVVGTFAEVGVASSINAPGITTLNDGDIAVAVCAVNSSTQVWGTAPWTGDFQLTGAQCVAQSHLAMPTAGATGNATFALDSKDAGAIVFSIESGSPADPPPDAVDDLAGTAGNTKVDLTWTEPPLNGSTLLDPAYKVRFRTAGTGDAPVKVQTAAGTYATATRSPSFTFGSSDVQEGDVILAFPSSTNTATITIPSGWVNVLGGTTDVESDSHELSGGYHVVTAGEVGQTAWTLTNWYDTTEVGNVVAILVRNVDPADVLDIAASAFNSGNTITPHVLAGLTPIVDGGFIVSCVAKDGTGNYTTPPAGWSLDQTSNTGNGKALLTRDALSQSGVAVPATNITPSAGDEYASITVVLNPIATPAGSWIELPPDISIPASVTASVETEVWSGASGDVADDPAIYYHSADPASSIVLGSSKSTGADGGVHSFDLSGNLLDSWLVGEVNSVDLIDTATVDVDTSWADRVLVLATQRGDGDLVFGFLNRTTGEITSAGTAAVGWEPYGCCLYVSPLDGSIYAFVNEATSGSNRWRQFELTVSGSTVSGSLVRSGSTESLAEGLCADYQNNRILIGIEDDRLAWFLPEPGDSTTLNTIEAEGVHFTADIEGITVIPAINGQHGVIIVSSQGSSEFVVYNLDDDSYMGTFTVNAGSVDAANNTDGIAALRVPMGSWTNGLLVVHDDTNTGGGASNFKFVDLGDVLGSIPGEFTLAGTSATVGGLTNGIEYEFQVQALSDVGPSDWSNIAGPYTPVASSTDLNLHFGDSLVDALYLGDSVVDALYLGDTQIF